MASSVSHFECIRKVDIYPEKLSWNCVLPQNHDKSCRNLPKNCFFIRYLQILFNITDKSRLHQQQKKKQFQRKIKLEQHSKRHVDISTQFFNDFRQRNFQGTYIDQIRYSGFSRCLKIVSTKTVFFLQGCLAKSGEICPEKGFNFLFAENLHIKSSFRANYFLTA